MFIKSTRNKGAPHLKGGCRFVKHKGGCRFVFPHKELKNIIFFIINL